MVFCDLCCCPRLSPGAWVAALLPPTARLAAGEADSGAPGLLRTWLPHWCGGVCPPPAAPRPPLCRLPASAAALSSGLSASAARPARQQNSAYLLHMLGKGCIPMLAAAESGAQLLKIRKIRTCLMLHTSNESAHC